MSNEGTIAAPERARQWHIVSPDGRTWSADTRVAALSACMRDTRTPESDARLLESLRKDREEAETSVAEVMRLVDLATDAAWDGSTTRLEPAEQAVLAAVRSLAGLE